MRKQQQHQQVKKNKQTTYFGKQPTVGKKNITLKKSLKKKVKKKHVAKTTNKQHKQVEKQHEVLKSKH